MFGYLCLVMKHSLATLVMSNFQRDPTIKTWVSPCLDAGRALINSFDNMGVGKTIYILTKTWNLKVAIKGGRLFTANSPLLSRY
jgi:hypothetical protein